MALENWFGVAEDVINVISFFAKILDDKTDPRSAPYLLGPLNLYTDNDGAITASNTGSYTVTMGIYGIPTDRVAGLEVSVKPNHEQNVTDLIEQAKDSGGVLSVFPSPLDQERAAGDVTFSQAITLGAMALTSILAVQLASNLQVSYNAGEGLSFNYTGDSANPIVIALVNSLANVTTALIARYNPAGDQTASQTFKVALPKGVLSDNEFKSLTILLIDP